MYGKGISASRLVRFCVNWQIRRSPHVRLSFRTLDTNPVLKLRRHSFYHYNPGVLLTDIPIEPWDVATSYAQPMILVILFNNGTTRNHEISTLRQLPEGGFQKHPAQPYPQTPLRAFGGREKGDVIPHNHPPAAAGGC